LKTTIEAIPTPKSKPDATAIFRFVIGRVVAVEYSDSQLLLTGVAVEKLHFPQNSEKLGDRKCPGKLRESFVGLPSAKFFAQFSEIDFFNTHRP
jgi:hypothetical protein